MPKADDKLFALLDAYYDDTVGRICNRLQKLSPSHYENIDFERHQEREEEFLDLLKKVLSEQDWDALRTYVENLAEKRSNEGYSLKEVQQAFDAIEDEIWETIKKSGQTKNDLIAILRTCRNLFNVARNEFSRAFLDKQITHQNKMNTLKERFYLYRHDRKNLPDDDS